MEGATTLIGNPTLFPITSKDFLSQPYGHVSASTARKRKPVVTYQSPGSGVVDVELLMRNTAFEIEAVAAKTLRSISKTSPSPVAVPIAETSNSTTVQTTSTISSATETTTITLPVYRPLPIPRPPRPLYHPLSRPSTSKSTFKASTSTESTSPQLVPPTQEPGRRSSSRTRRPAPKMRDTESLVSITKATQDKPSPVKRRRGPAAGKRKRTAAQQEAEGDSAYPAAKRPRKPREKMDVEIDGDGMPPPTDEASPNGYSTRAKRPRKAVHARAGSSTSDGTGSVARTTPVNGPVEEFWVPTKAT